MPASSDSQRFDPVTPIHKAARHLMFEVLGRVGALDAGDIFEVDLCGRQVLRLLRLLPASVGEPLQPLLQALLQQRQREDRAAAAGVLCHALTRVVAEQLQAQLKTEAEHTPLLQAQHTDLELRLLRRQQLAALSEDELAEALQPMAEALTPQELAAFVDDLQMSVDRQTFDCLLDSLRRRTSAGRWQRLARELGLPDTGSLPATRSTRGDLAGAPSHGGATTRRAWRADRHRLRTSLRTQ